MEDLARPERLAQIRVDHDKRVERLKRKRLVNVLQDEAIEIDEVYGSAGKMCITCHK
ncbi:hypothetical protein D3C75_990790 [compost metagenome]